MDTHHASNGTPAPAGCPGIWVSGVSPSSVQGYTEVSGHGGFPDSTQAVLDERNTTGSWIQKSWLRALTLPEGR